jgi:hypothetical protein
MVNAPSIMAAFNHAVRNGANATDTELTAMLDVLFAFTIVPRRSLLERREIADALAEVQARSPSFGGSMVASRSTRRWKNSLSNAAFAAPRPANRCRRRSRRRERRLAFSLELIASGARAEIPAPVELFF